MNRARRSIVAVVLLVVFGIRPGSAHHSYAMFDLARPSEVTGTVYSVEWTNPHVWLWVSVTDDTGAPVLYAFEGSGIGEMIRKFGWTRNAVKAGEKVTVKYLPFRDGKAGGRFNMVILPDGRTVGG